MKNMIELYALFEFIEVNVWLCVFVVVIQW